MTNEVEFQTTGNLGLITLNRPQALNALNTPMCLAMTEKLLEWEKSPKVSCILIKGAGDRAFCAGGDIIMLHNSGRDGTNEAEVFWRTEYALNELIHTFSKPYIALIDGITMGGGVGLSVHGAFRIAGPKTLFAMPETGIGYFPDVGGTYFLPRLGRAIGNWLGLTGARIDGTIACKIGVATNYFDGDIKELISSLSEIPIGSGNNEVAKILAKICTSPSESELPKGVSCFDHEGLGEIFESLESSNDEWCASQLKILKTKSPLSLQVTLRAMAKGANLSFRECMIRELDLSLNHLKSPDFYEGIRAQVIDKDRNPKWQNESFENCTESEIAAIFKMNSEILQFIDRGK